ncbi:protein of unknown function - conserved [Leishmania donovani]|uniref:Uncharacterized protein n=3 Tax=Leishmania donovani species complex TaxID=38574 RepID=A4I8Q8_LEIIN|nr:conserved hypothetical protein [Leishmania infantum JPCM5]TPP55643.1 hypothetical protein CGC20_11185 [Leishmania donovani]CAC9530097.1 hypothetical_protein_-_conserved [Leishmania infantum]CAJ1992011.1 protein of unknown function - conserved [Leishmania donovani]CAM71207.1 conserved hypothetical protein [Leishmania infantum JPCM5]SUZ45043.1 hypothetical_protein_-_conserved [Leishmania infantum]|eukprot:XP_001468127.1 conserved hypothetical protein [Leishmania infantum JPCM5]
MLEKVVPIPFLGKEVSGWLYRTTRWTREHPYRATAILAACIGGSILYEAQVTHKNRMPSPNVNNHLEYQLKEASLWERWFRRASTTQQDMKAEEVAALENAGDMLTPEEITRRQRLSQRTIADAERLLATTTDAAERQSLEKVIEREKELMKGVNNTTMLVRSGQLEVRAPHWEIRNNERNWSILSRDQQQQKDHYWYRLERSREDDFARNTYSTP